MRSKFSEKEIKMFEELGFKAELDYNLITPMQMYNFAIVKCFMERIDNLASTSLRHCFYAIESGKPRLTIEFDDLILLG